MPQHFALLPERIFVGNTQWVQGKALLLRGRKIADICSPSRLPRKIEIVALPGMALLPGFFNAHTHLEYTDASFRKPLRPGFVEWLNAIFTWKAGRKPGDVPASLRRGADLCLQGGTVAVGDHYCGEGVPAPLLQSPLKGIVFHEIISRNPGRAQEQLARIRRRKAAFPADGLKFGVALHAPYTVSDVLTRGVLAWARKNHVPLTMHVGESREEAEFFRKPGSPLALWLEEKSGVQWNLPPTDPIAHAARQGLWKSAGQAVHMNLARPGHLPLLPRAKARIAYCPGSHEYFRHPRFPLEMFLSKGYCVALGTDGLVSNDGLNMFDELRLAHKLHPKVPLETLWDMATAAGAKSLGYPRGGSLKKGYDADVIGIPAGRTRHPLRQALEFRGKVPFLALDGKIVFRPPNC